MCIFLVSSISRTGPLCFEHIFPFSSATTAAISYNNEQPRTMGIAPQQLNWKQGDLIWPILGHFLKCLFLFEIKVAQENDYLLGYFLFL